MVHSHENVGKKHTSPIDLTGQHAQKSHPPFFPPPRSSKESSSRSGGNQTTSMTESFAAVGRKAHGSGLVEVPSMTICYPPMNESPLKEGPGSKGNRLISQASILRGYLSFQGGISDFYGGIFPKLATKHSNFDPVNLGRASRTTIDLSGELRGRFSIWMLNQK